MSALAKQRTTSSWTSLGDALVAKNAITREEIEECVKVAAESGRRLGEVLLQHSRVDEADIYRVLAEQHGLRVANVDELLAVADSDVMHTAPRAFLEHNHLMPIVVNNGRLLVASADVDSLGTDLGNVFDVDHVDTVIVTPTDYRRLWAAVDLDVHGHERASFASDDKALPTDLLTSDRGLERRFVALLDALLLDAVAERASDIHFERYENDIRIRLRVDGELRDHTHHQLSSTDLLGLINVVKIRADLDISERRLPQGGRCAVRVGDQGFDLRVQTQPSLYGEHAVVRLLPQTQRLLSTKELGFPSEVAEQYERLLHSPGGLVLVVGPTGSGKSTTLYAGLQILAQESSRKVITVEDPIEYAIRDVQQTQVKPEIGFSFANAMRAFVRQDPDVILVGEIRDNETALEAIRASQTGHLVLSTLHCNDTTDTVQRLLDLHMHPNSIASELLAIFAQRLAKRCCPACRAPADADPEIVAELFPDQPDRVLPNYRGSGCERCDGHGTRGRVAVIEYLRASPALRMAISRQLPVDELRQVAAKSGMITMRASALHLVETGIIPLSELPRLLPPERMCE